MPLALTPNAVDNRAMMRFRPLVALVLTLALAISSAGFAAARAHPGFAGWMDLCAGSESVTVAVDAAGQPLKPRQSCPDCVSGPVATVPPSVVVPRPVTGGNALRSDVNVVRLTRAAPLAQARGPPSGI